MAKLNVFTLENLTLYDSLLKQYINAGDAKSIKKVTLDGRTLSFFKSEAEGATADFVVTIPEQDLTALQNAIKANEDAIKAINDEATGILKTAKDYADEKVQALADGAVKDNADAIDALEGRADAVEGRATALETTVNKLDGADTVEGSVKAQIKAAKEELEGKITASEYDDTEVRELISANAEAAKKAQDEVDALEGVVAGMYTNDQIDGFVADAKKAGTDAQAAVEALEEVVSGNKTDIEARVKAIEDDYLVEADKTALEEAIQANADAIDAHEAKIDGVVETLVGDDTGKSVRTIANEELAKQLIAEGAKESLDTLEEIAAWIQSHPEDASAMNKAIEDLEALVGELPEGVEATTVIGYITEAVAAEQARAEAIEKDLADRITELETAVGEGGSVDSQIDAKIAELDADVTSATVEEGKGVQVQVVEVDGKVTTVAVTGNYDNKYDALGSAEAKANTAETNAKDHADGLNTAMNERVTVVEGLVGDGYQAIPEADINALFA